MRGGFIGFIIKAHSRIWDWVGGTNVWQGFAIMTIQFTYSLCGLKPLDIFVTENKIKVHRFTEGNGERLEILFHQMLYFLRKH